MKVGLYASDVNINRKDEKEKRNIDLLGNKRRKRFFLVQVFYNPMVYLASIMF